MIRNQVAPVAHPKVKGEHVVGVFGRFDDVVAAAIARLEATERPDGKEKARFFRYLNEMVDHKKFAEMQEYYLAPENLDLKADIVKYIDPTVWFESKIGLAHQMNLKDRPPINILDIGTGPAHFPVVARFYGHHVLGTDLPARTNEGDNRKHIYDALCDIYQIERIPLMIEQFAPLPKFERRYNLVTAFLAAFNVGKDKLPWTVDAWKYLMNDLRAHVLTEDGEVFMSLANDKLTDEVWSYLSNRAVYSHDRSKRVHFVDLSSFAD